MYKAYIDGRIMYNPQLEDDGYDIFSPKLVSEVNKAASFTFTIYPQNPEYSNLTKLKSIITVFDDDVLKFRGRVLNDVLNWNNDKAVTCEGELSFFNDSIVRPYDYTTGGIGVSDYVHFLVGQHNKQVDASRQFTVRNITVTDHNNLIVRGNGNYPNTLDEINDKLINLLGGYIFLEHIGDVTYLDYLADSPYITSQKIELSKNLLDLQKTVKGEAIATAIIPLGAQLNDSSGQNLGSRLTLKNDDGTDYISDSAAVEKYGLIFKTVTYDDITTQNALLTRAKTDLETAVNPTSTLTLTAIDLNMVDKTIDKLNVFEYVEADSSPHGIYGRFLITKIELDLVNPENSKVNIGADYTVLSDPNRGLNAVKSYVESAQSGQTKYVNGRIQVVQASIQDKFEDMDSWIRYVNGEIQLGQIESPISLSIKDDSVDFRSNGRTFTSLTSGQSGIGLKLHMFDSAAKESVVYLKEDGTVNLQGDTDWQDLTLNSGFVKVATTQFRYKIANHVLYVQATNISVSTSISAGNDSTIATISSGINLSTLGYAGANFLCLAESSATVLSTARVTLKKTGNIQVHAYSAINSGNLLNFNLAIPLD